MSYLRKLFKDLFYRQGYEYDYVFDWMVKKPTIPTSITSKGAEEEKQNEGNEEKADAEKNVES